MDKSGKKSYAAPFLLRQVDVLLEGNLLGGSVVEQVQPVETAGQQIDGIYDGNASAPSSATFNYDWGE